MTPETQDALTAMAFGATSAGHVELTGVHPAVARYNAQSLLQQAGALALDQRDRDAALRRALLPAPTATVRILACGDSITVGYGSSDNAGWRPWLADLIDRQRVQAVMSMHAHGGWILAQMAEGLPAVLAATDPDLVLVNIGTNDWASDTAAHQASYLQMIDLILASSPTVRVACAVIPISQATSIQASEQRVNTAIRGAVAQRAGTGRVALSDHSITTQARWTSDATEPGSYPPPGRWTFDGVHPTDAAYLQMAQQWLTTIQPWVPGLTL